MDIEFYNNESNYRLTSKRLIRFWLREVALAERGCKITHINYIFCSSNIHRQMNIDFVGHDYFTDIITFDDSNLRKKYIAGEIYIDVETVRDNSRIYQTTFLTEMRRVIVHGVLHLCGQNDKTPYTERTMHRKENKYLRLLDKMKAQKENGKL